MGGLEQVEVRRYMDQVELCLRMMFSMGEKDQVAVMSPGEMVDQAMVQETQAERRSSIHLVLMCIWMMVSLGAECSLLRTVSSRTGRSHSGYQVETLMKWRAFSGRLGSFCSKHA